MQRHIAASILVLLATPLGVARAQFGFHSKRETFSVPVSHPPEIVLPNVKRIAITGFVGSVPCGQLIKDLLSETVTRSGTFELVPVPVGQDVRAPAFTNRANAVRVAQVLGPTAIIEGNVLRCDAETSPLKSDRSKDKKGRIHTSYSRSTTAHLALSVQIIDVASSKVVLYRNFASDPVEERNSYDEMPDVVDPGQLIGQATTAAEQNIEHLLFGWRESISVTVHADKECDLKPASDQIRAGDFTGAAETMQKAIDRQCGAPDDKVALAKAYHNRGVALTYAGRPEEGLKSLQQSNSLWPGNISEEAMSATRKIIAARGEQQIQDAAATDAAKVATANSEAEKASLLSNNDVMEMVQAKLSDQVILGKMRTTKCKFDASPSALIRLKKSGASDAVMLAITNAQCTS
jgi:hypothetical protein